jgi:hypothetical protein
MQRAAEDLRGEPADVLRRQVERVCEVFASCWFHVPIALPQISLRGPFEALPVIGGENPGLLLPASGHRCGHLGSDDRGPLPTR